MANTKVTIELDSPLLESVVGGKVFQADASKMDNRGLVEILRYGFQRKINDGTGGKDVTDEAKHEAAEKKVARCMDGTIADRARGAGPADPYRELRKYIRAILRRNKSVKELAEKHGVKVASDFVDSVFDKMNEKNRAVVLKLAQQMWDDEHADVDID